MPIDCKQKHARNSAFKDLIGFGTGRKKLSVLGTSGDHLGTIWEIDSVKLSISLRNRAFRSAWIDPSRLRVPLERELRKIVVGKNQI